MNSAANIIDAIYNLVTHPVTELRGHSAGRNRANDMGTALEDYVKDLFAGTFTMDEMSRIKRQSEVFSYIGNNSNPPDAMLRGGDAIEVKKIESPAASLALNSSYPKHVLTRDSTMLSRDCKTAENWDKKDLIYAVGVVQKGGNTLQRLCMVYGMDYCASEECYTRIKETIKAGVEAIPGIDFAESKELGHINRVDPLGITYLRVRGMWGIENPWRVYSYLLPQQRAGKFDFMCVINQEKWDTFPNTERIITLQAAGFSIRDVIIKDPDNPAHIKKAKLITFVK